MQFFYFFRLYLQCPEISTERVKGRRFQMRLWSLKLIKYLLIKGFHVKKWYVTCPQTWFEICELHKLLNSKTYLIWGSVKSLRWPECANYLNIYRRSVATNRLKTDSQSSILHEELTRDPTPSAFLSATSQHPSLTPPSDHVYIEM